MIIDLITKAQEGNEDAALLMIKKFNPLLKKYAYKLSYEDAYDDLLLDFIELIHNIRLDHIRNKDEGSMVSYICTSVRASYIKRLMDIKKLHDFISFSELSEGDAVFRHPLMFFVSKLGFKLGLHDLLQHIPEHILDFRHDIARAAEVLLPDQFPYDFLWRY
jgi:hypothetical protein